MMEDNIMIRRINQVLSLLFIIILLFSCSDNPVDSGGSGGIDPGIVFNPPYNSPIWYPSGKFIGFNHTPLIRIRIDSSYYRQYFKSDSSGFWLINPDGTNMRRIFPYTLQGPAAWSPDGQWIAFVLGEQIYKMKFSGTTFDTTTIVQLTTEGRNFFPAWSPDGKWIAYDSDNDSPNGMKFLWKMKIDGTEKTRIAYEPTKGEIRVPSWNKDGDKIVHIRYSPNYFSSEIYTMDIEGKKLNRLTYNENRDTYPQYTPDGKEIAFISNSNLWLMDSTGGNLRQLTTLGVDTDSGPPFSWSPDGTNIVYTVYRPNDWTYDNGTLWILNINSCEKKQLTFNQKPKE